MAMICSDWEGPWVIADHAYEVAKKGITDGDRLFAGISEYDDYLSCVRRKEGYEPGDTLALIAPFLIAYDVDDRLLINVARENANFIEGAFEAIRTLRTLGYCLKVVSTSYCQYVHYTTSIAGISSGDVRCTYFPINKYHSFVEESDKKLVRGMVHDIIDLPKLGINASTVEKDLPSYALQAIKKLDDFFWTELPKTSFGQVLRELTPLGGRRKFNAVEEALEEEGKELHETVIIGDSITDWVMLRETRDAGGLAVAFNGNDYAVRNANLAVLSDNCMITPIIVDLFEKRGIDRLSELAENWNTKSVKDLVRSRDIDPLIYRKYIESLESSSQTKLPEVIWVTKENVEATVERSKAIRKTVRGIAVGSLG
jgi:energy-converting hydrogenase A subunit R